jgi:hypothetical protein
LVTGCGWIRVLDREARQAARQKTDIFSGSCTCPDAAVFRRRSAQGVKKILTGAAFKRRGKCRNMNISEALPDAGEAPPAPDLRHSMDFTRVV